MLKFIINTIDDNCKISILKWFMLNPFFVLYFTFIAILFVLFILAVVIIFIMTGKKDAMECYDMLIGKIL